MKQQDESHIMKNPEDPENNRLLASNRKARHDYDVIDVVEAGIVLLGSEVKSIRSGEVQIADAYAHASNGEMWLDGMHIGAYAFANGSDAHDPTRRRKLLMHKEQIRRLQDRIAQERLTLVPLELRLSKGKVKLTRIVEPIPAGNKASKAWRVLITPAGGIPASVTPKCKG